MRSGWRGKWKRSCSVLASSLVDDEVVFVGVAVEVAVDDGGVEDGEFADFCFDAIEDGADGFFGPCGIRRGDLLPGLNCHWPRKRAISSM